MIRLLRITAVIVRRMGTVRPAAREDVVRYDSYP
jgi:hypothetical protein